MTTKAHTAGQIYFDTSLHLYATVPPNRQSTPADELRADDHVASATSHANANRLALRWNAHDDLLEALEVAVDILVRLTPPIQQGTLCEEQDHATALRLARAAIARAKGGEA